MIYLLLVTGFILAWAYYWSTHSKSKDTGTAFVVKILSFALTVLLLGYTVVEIIKSFVGLFS